MIRIFRIISICLIFFWLTMNVGSFPSQIRIHSRICFFTYFGVVFFLTDDLQYKYALLFNIFIITAIDDLQQRIFFTAFVFLSESINDPDQRSDSLVCTVSRSVEFCDCRAGV